MHLSLLFEDIGDIYINRSRQTRYHIQDSFLGPGLNGEGGRFEYVLVAVIQVGTWGAGRPYMTVGRFKAEEGMGNREIVDHSKMTITPQWNRSSNESVLLTWDLLKAGSVRYTFHWAEIVSMERYE